MNTNINSYIIAGDVFHKGLIRTNRFEAESSQEQGRCTMVTAAAKILNIRDCATNLD